MKVLVLGGPAEPGKHGKGFCRKLHSDTGAYFHKKGEKEADA